MNDVDLEWNGDISFGPTGDLAIVGGQQTISQRISRRLLTNTGDYLWQLEYGASLGRFVGAPIDSNVVEAVIRSQVALEPALPDISALDVLVSSASDGSGLVSAMVSYADPTSQASVALNINVAGDTF